TLVEARWHCWRGRSGVGRRSNAAGWQYLTTSDDARNAPRCSRVPGSAGSDRPNSDSPNARPTAKKLSRRQTRKPLSTKRARDESGPEDLGDAPSRSQPEPGGAIWWRAYAALLSPEGAVPRIAICSNRAV